MSEGGKVGSHVYVPAVQVLCKLSLQQPFKVIIPAFIFRRSNNVFSCKYISSQTVGRSNSNFVNA